MIRSQRLKFLSKLAQQTNSIEIRALPNFNASLFSTRPDIINDFGSLVNRLNKYIQLLNVNVSFSMVYTNPSITGSEYTNSLKNLFNLSKWLYDSILTPRRAAYSIQDLVKIFSDIANNISQFSFPELNLANAQNDLITLARTAIAKLSPTK